MVPTFGSHFWFPLFEKNRAEAEVGGGSEAEAERGGRGWGQSSKGFHKGRVLCKII